MNPEELPALKTSKAARRWKPFVAPSCLLVAAFALQLFAAFNPHLTEHYYSRTAYPRVVQLLSFAGSLTRLSLAEVLSAVLLVLLFAWLTAQAHSLIRKRAEARALLLSLLKKSLWTIGIGASVFMLAFGFNYRRLPLAENLELEQREPLPYEADFISRALIEGINRNYAEGVKDNYEEGGDNRVENRAAADERGSSMPLSREQLYEVVKSAYESEPLLRELAAGGAAPPKPVYFSSIMSRFGISGIYSPFTGEPNYNAAQVDCDLPFTIAHEMAHQRGFARESEANFVAFLVCIKASHPYVRYSGFLNALRVLGVLQRASPERYREMLASIEPGPRADLKARAAFWARYRGRLSDFGNRLNHAYLRANGIKSGVRNYNESVWLIIGYYLKHASVPDSAAR